MMTGLIILFAIMNLGLAFSLALLRRCAAPGQAPSAGSRSDDGVRPNSIAQSPAEAASRAADGLRVEAGASIGLKQGPGHPNESARRAELMSTAPNLLADGAEQLRGLREQLRFVRIGNDRRLVRDLANQIWNCAHAWDIQLLSVVEEAAPSQPDKAITPGVDSNCLEMCLAQLESTLSNIDALDLAAALEAQQSRLEREIDSLQNVLASLHAIEPDSLPRGGHDSAKRTRASSRASDAAGRDGLEVETTDLFSSSACCNVLSGIRRKTRDI